MRVLLIMDPGIAIPPTQYGGHERLVHIFAEEYSKLGHKVSLLAGPESKISGKVYAFGINDLKRSKYQKLKELTFAWKFLIRHKNEFDLIHNFGRLAYLLPVLNASVKKIMTYGRPVNKKGIRLFNFLPNRNLIFTACSNYCVSTGNIAGKWKTVYNSIDFSKYELTEKVADDAPFIFLGRMDKIKGLQTAIEIALKTNNKLWIGGNIPTTPDNYQYFKEIIEPRFDGKQIIYLGALNDQEKNKYLGESKALLFPIEWDEPFGMVMIEAMACGTPVIAFKRGSTPEIILHGENGYLADDFNTFLSGAVRYKDISRIKTRLIAERNFSSLKIAGQYINLFNEVF
jgi:glycosyltransferase involved in cell wall biosynthesis